MKNCVNITWRNGFGNQLFQYTLGRLIAEENNLELTYSSELGRCCSFSLLDCKFINQPECIVKYNSNKHSIKHQIDYDGNMIYDNLENPKTYENYLDKIKSWFPKVEKKNLKDLVVHIRRGDCGENVNISIDWYLNVMENIDYENVYVVTDEPTQLDVQKVIKKTKATIFSAKNVMSREIDKNFIDEILIDFNFIRSFDKILFPNSTFSWWASVLSDASEVYFNSDWQLRHKNGKVKLGKTNYKNWKGYNEAYNKNI